uniref:Uncharacterized protein n=1 Tax=Rhodosorus marinus TaxID=101924 RepID=A0A7S3EDA1_9RHOD
MDKMKILPAVVVVLGLLGGLACGSGVSLGELSLRSSPTDLRKCSFFTKKFDYVRLGVGARKCYKLRVFKGNQDEVGTVCTTLVEQYTNLCVKFKFRMRRGWEITQGRAGLKGDCRNPGIFPFQDTKSGPQTSMVLTVCLYEFQVPKGDDHEGCCNKDICMFIKAKVRKVGKTSIKNAYPEQLRENRCAIRGDTPFVSCKRKLTCKNDGTTTPVPTPKPTESPLCQEYADGFDDVFVIGDDNESCYRLVPTPDVALPTPVEVCITATEMDGKNCLRYSFKTENDIFALKTVRAGASADCSGLGSDSFQVEEAADDPSMHVVNVCLDEFTAPPGDSGEGCCNNNICVSMEADFDVVVNQVESFLAVNDPVDPACAAEPPGEQIGCQLSLGCVDVEPTSPPVPRTTAGRSQVPYAREQRIELEPEAMEMPE